MARSREVGPHWLAPRAPCLPQARCDFVLLRASASVRATSKQHLGKLHRSLGLRWKIPLHDADTQLLILMYKRPEEIEQTKQWFIYYIAIAFLPYQPSLLLLSPVSLNQGIWILLAATQGFPFCMVAWCQSPLILLGRKRLGKVKEYHKQEALVWPMRTHRQLCPTGGHTHIQQALREAPFTSEF